VEALKEAVGMEDLEGDSMGGGGNNPEARKRKAAMRLAALKLNPDQLFTSGVKPETGGQPLGATGERATGPPVRPRVSGVTNASGEGRDAGTDAPGDPAVFQQFASSLEAWAPHALRDRPKRSLKASSEAYSTLLKRQNKEEKAARAAASTDVEDRRLLQKIGEFQQELQGLLVVLWTSTGEEREKREKLIRELEEKKREVDKLRETRWGTSNAAPSLNVVAGWIDRAIRRARAALQQQQPTTGRGAAPAGQGGGMFVPSPAASVTSSAFPRTVR